MTDDDESLSSEAMMVLAPANSSSSPYGGASRPTTSGMRSSDGAAGIQVFCVPIRDDYTLEGLYFMVCG